MFLICGRHYSNKEKQGNIPGVKEGLLALHDMLRQLGGMEGIIKDYENRKVSML